MEKKRRAYSCLLFQSHYDYFICIPYRSEIQHKYAFRFSNTKRSRVHRSGLDYSKIVIITKTEFLDPRDAIIDKDEFKQTIMHLKRIKLDALKFVEDYVFHMQGSQKLNDKEFERRYRFSPLKYFHTELGLQEPR